ncbi:MAG: hypothetical protein BWY96_01098 [Spirochaetes bacterium ADurb.BinA120]|nr:MAG: hypothetical protein BWY96_01098 [Spirochaetes bacterium ADurb.BinA120]
MADRLRPAATGGDVRAGHRPGHLQPGRRVDEPGRRPFRRRGGRGRLHGRFFHRPLHASGRLSPAHRLAVLGRGPRRRDVQRGDLGGQLHRRRRDDHRPGRRGVRHVHPARGRRDLPRPLPPADGRRDLQRVRRSGHPDPAGRRDEPGPGRLARRGGRRRVRGGIRNLHAVAGLHDGRRGRPAGRHVELRVRPEQPGAGGGRVGNGQRGSRVPLAGRSTHRPGHGRGGLFRRLRHQRRGADLRPLARRGRDRPRRDLERRPRLHGPGCGVDLAGVHQRRRRHRGRGVLRPEPDALFDGLPRRDGPVAQRQRAGPGRRRDDRGLRRTPRQRAERGRRHHQRHVDPAACGPGRYAQPGPGLQCVGGGHRGLRGHADQRRPRLRVDRPAGRHPQLRQRRQRRRLGRRQATGRVAGLLRLRLGRPGDEDPLQRHVLPQRRGMGRVVHLHRGHGRQQPGRGGRHGAGPLGQPDARLLPAPGGGSSADGGTDRPRRQREHSPRHAEPAGLGHGDLPRRRGRGHRQVHHHRRGRGVPLHGPRRRGGSACRRAGAGQRVVSRRDLPLPLHGFVRSGPGGRGVHRRRLGRHVRLARSGQRGQLHRRPGPGPVGPPGALRQHRRDGHGHCHRRHGPDAQPPHRRRRGLGDLHTEHQLRRGDAGGYLRPDPHDALPADRPQYAPRPGLVRRDGRHELSQDRPSPGCRHVPVEDRGVRQQRERAVLRPVGDGEKRSKSRDPVRRRRRRDEQPQPLLRPGQGPL